ncbi:MAG: HyaD/HybD family hydrogenase maturation endopeptidase [Rhodocyclaceae bacterium]|nr:HyaD/HybD family hydrogenase maturation endopeptidase [Rhodocyclaceae bacterium]
MSQLLPGELDGPLDALILGIGNVLWADEGFGVRCAEAFAAEWQTPPGVMVMDGGSQGLYLLPYVQAARRLIVFDAIDYGLEPGTLKRVEDDQVPRFMGAKKMSLHQTGFQEVIAAAALTDQLPKNMLLIGVQPEELEDYGGSLRPVVKARIAQSVALAVEQLRAWGIAIERRQGPAATRSGESRILDIDNYEAGRPSAELACRFGDARVLDLHGQT